MEGNTKDYYGTLQVPKEATLQEIKTAYRRLALAFHPDKNPDPSSKQKFQSITEAYSVLSDPEKREMYDTYGTAEMDELDMSDLEDLLGSDFIVDLGFIDMMDFLGPLMGFKKGSESGESMDEEELRNFQEFVNNNTIKIGDEYKCGICSRKFKTKEATTKHIGNKHDEVFYGEEDEEGE
ncbi:unnamed protein product [Blepharisma stoltei]|uniref:DnaJ-like protein n=1 Tax=Blepharisma stoltei TaxID=1481888 RepID=A0AAU9J5V1_9CILI|nr:unnamed protein product [Blepharisma stoltei]